MNPMSAHSGRFSVIFPAKKFGRRNSSDELAPIRTQPKIGRNVPCPCGSGRKNKHCCNK